MTAGWAAAMAAEAVGVDGAAVMVEGQRVAIVREVAVMQAEESVKVVLEVVRAATVVEVTMGVVVVAKVVLAGWMAEWDKWGACLTPLPSESCDLQSHSTRFEMKPLPMRCSRILLRHSLLAANQ